MPTATGQHPWISLAEARRRAGIGHVALCTLIDQGLLTVRSIPGSKPRVLLSDLEAVIEASTRRSDRETHPCGE